MKAGGPLTGALRFTCLHDGRIYDYGGLHREGSVVEGNRARLGEGIHNTELVLLRTSSRWPVPLTGTIRA
jgi:hypothetical protein